MVKIYKQSSTLIIKGDVNSYPFNNGNIALPLNSLYFVIDESNVVSFKQVNDNNTLLSVNINDLQINGEQATKENLIEKFDSVANGNMGGSKLNAGTNITLQPQEDGSITISATGELTQSVDWNDVLNKPSDIINISDKLAEKLDTSTYDSDKSTFALKSEIPSIDNLATKEELTTKQDVLESGTNIKTINGQTLLGNGDISIVGDVTKQYVDEQLELKADKSSISDMLTKSEASSTYATKDEIPSLTDYLTIAQGDEKYQTKGNYITSEQVEETYAKKTEIPDTSTFATKEELEEKADVTALSTKQDTLISGTNIKTINGNSLLGEGNIEIQGGSGGGISDAPIDDKTYGRKNGNWSEIVIPSTDNFATKEDISDMLTKTEATSTYQPIGDYLTSIPEEYVTETELTEGLETKQPVGDYANRSDLSNYVLTETANETYQPIGDYVTNENAEATYAKKSDIPQEYTLPIASSESLGGIKVGAGLSINPETGVLNATGGGVADSVDWSNITSKPDDIVNITDKLAEKLDVSTYTSDKSTFATKEELNLKANTSDLSNYLTTVNAESTYAKKSEIPSLEGYLQASVAESTYATKVELESKVDDSEISDMLTKTEAASTYQPKGEYLTEIPSEYITESELDSKGYKKIIYITQSEYDELPTKEEGVLYVITDAQEVVIPDTSTLATKQEVTDGLATKQDKGNYITVETADGKYQPIGNYATTSQLNAKLDVETYNSDKLTFATKDELNLKANTSDLSNYLTTVNAESTYAKKSEIPSLEGYLQTSVADDKYATKTELSGKQDTLESGTNIKTINGESILGSGDIVIEGGSSDVDKAYVDEQLALKADKTSVPTVQSSSSGNENNYVYSIGYIEDKKNVLSIISVDSKSSDLQLLSQTWNNDTQSVIRIRNASSSKSGAMSSSDKQKLDSINTEDILTKTEASTTYALQSALQEALDRISALESQIGILTTQLDNINGEIV